VGHTVITCEAGAYKRSLTRKKQEQTNMKRNLLALAAVGAIAFSGFAVAQGENETGRGDRGGHGGHGHRNMLEHMTETLNLTPDQKAKIQPILDQAKPQVIAIHQEAMQKMKAVMDSTTSQIRPLLKPEQQQKLDNIRQAHENMRKAAKDLHDAKTK
jgi:Spy/CpxP family protein refolding chaperone